MYFRQSGKTASLYYPGQQRKCVRLHSHGEEERKHRTGKDKSGSIYPKTENHPDTGK